MPGFPLFPNSASTVAPQVDQMFLFLVAVALGMTFLIAGFIVYFTVKYRRRSEDEIPTPIEGSNKLEFAWTIIPFGFFMVLFFWGSSIYLNQSQPPPNTLPIYVVAKQWMWKFQHAGGQTEINELHVPLGRPVELTMTSQDVIHSFFVPDFRIKQDVLPDRLTTTWFQATETGQYHLFCAQYCGTEHAEMTGSVIVMDPNTFEEWLSGGAITEQSPADSGQQLFGQLGCIGCHKLDGTGVAPSFVGRYGKQVQTADGRTLTVDDNYLRTCILYPDRQRTAGFQPLMPSYFGRIDQEQLLHLIAYIKSLASQPLPRSP
ncbi:MAG: cytochrome c oxidase subunit II [Chloroflexi bacterium]|nr:cytochrome c oxidase subunit II [Chloroflexota bacterium]